MRYDRLITICAAGSRKAARWPAQTLRWSEMVSRLKTPVRGTETLVDYLRLPRARQDELKDVGGFVGGMLKEGLRRSGMVQSRDLVTLDMDTIPALATRDVLKAVSGLGCAYAAYSTRKHEPTRPRLRVVIPLSRSVTADEYEPIARRLAAFLGMERMDPTTFQAVRMMYWPSCCKDAEYVFAAEDKPMADADGLLRMYANWRDVNSWPQVPGLPKLEAKQLSRQEDPLRKTGVIGAFCRTYSIEEAMETFLPGVYVPCGENRYTYAGGSTTGGAILYDGKFLYSHHATDPCSEKLVNAFDLVRLHRYAYLDDEAQPGTPVGRLPSYSAMTQLATGDARVRAMLLSERAEAVRMDFGVGMEGGAGMAGGAAMGKASGAGMADGGANATASDPTASGAANATASEGAEGSGGPCGPLGPAPRASGAQESNMASADGPKGPDVQTPWLGKLAVNSKGVILPTAENVRIILQNDPRLRGLVAYDRFAVRMMVMREAPWATAATDKQSRRPWTDSDGAGLRWYLETGYGVKGRQTVDDALVTVSNQNAFDDVGGYVEGLVWDGTPRIDTMLVKYLGAEDSAYTRAVTRKSLAACIARARRPGVKFDYVLTLVGGQGLGKSTLLQMLGKDWFNASLTSFNNNKDASELIQGSWVVELGELASLSHSELNIAKQFITRTSDRFRAAYGRYAEDSPRRCVFFGTTNKNDFLRDETGDRRFWPVAVKRRMRPEDFAEFASLVDQFWAEAKAYDDLGERLYLDDAQLEAAARAQQERYREDDGLEGQIRAFLERRIPTDWYAKPVRERRAWLQNEFGQADAAAELLPRTKICAREVWAECMGKDLAYCDNPKIREINRALERLGWESTRTRFGGEYGLQRGYVKP